MATERLMATPWRFEKNKGGQDTLRKAQDDKINEHNRYMNSLLYQNK